jgi:hypothetical protein
MPEDASPLYTSRDNASGAVASPVELTEIKGYSAYSWHYVILSVLAKDLDAGYADQILRGVPLRMTVCARRVPKT